MDAINLSRVREGHIHAERPQIITPQTMARLMLEGFGDQGERFAEQISAQPGRFAFLKYGFRVSKSDIRSYDVHESLANVSGKLKEELEHRNEPLTALLTGVDDGWEGLPAQVHARPDHRLRARQHGRFSRAGAALMTLLHPPPLREGRDPRAGRGRPVRLSRREKIPEGDRAGFRRRASRLSRGGISSGATAISRGPTRRGRPTSTPLSPDPEIDGVIALRGGYGSCRILPLLDYGAIRAHPKIFLGYSDNTALHHAILKKSGLVTFHGPNASEAFLPVNAAYPAADAARTARRRFVSARECAEDRRAGPRLGPVARR